MEHTLAALWIPLRRIGKGLQDSRRRKPAPAAAVQRDSDRLESGQSTRGEGTYARRAVDPAETHWQGPRTAAAASLHRAAAGQRDSGRLESGQSTRGEGTHARRAVDPAETHWQGHRTAAVASLHKAAAGQRDSGLLESAGQSTRGEGTHAQSCENPRETPLARAPGTATAGSPAHDGLGCMWTGQLNDSRQSSRCAGSKQRAWRTLVGAFAAQRHPGKAARPRRTCGRGHTQSGQVL